MKKITTSVRFETEDAPLQTLYDLAEELAAKNIIDFPGQKVLIEGSALYPNVWLETQPMGGDMYSKRNMEVALNNQLIFMDHQREDGRLPGMVSVSPDKELICHYDWFQGYCFPSYALHMYYMLKKDRPYLEKLYTVLERFDAYLWKYRDSNGDGCLETWCVYDTGEDEAARLEGAPNSWGGEVPPKGIGRVPYASMDVMGYSIEGRRILAKIAKILGNGKEAYWQEKTQQVIDKLHSYLWIEEKGACYDRDCDGKFMDVLIHNNIRVMHFGGFTQEMADRFVAEHLLNPDEFWTPMPLPSVAFNDPLYRNDSFNSWAGQPEALTYQRAIQAMENYGYYSIITKLGRIYLSVMAKHKKFGQQFDAQTMLPTMPQYDGYGPAVLTVLEYICKLYGVYIGCDEIEYSGLAGEPRSYTQEWDGDRFTIEANQEWLRGYKNGELLFTCTAGVRVVTDLEGRVLRLVGIDDVAHDVTLTYDGKAHRFQVYPDRRIELRV